MCRKTPNMMLLLTEHAMLRNKSSYVSSPVTLYHISLLNIASCLRELRAIASAQSLAPLLPAVQLRTSPLMPLCLSVLIWKMRIMIFPAS